MIKPKLITMTVYEYRELKRGRPEKSLQALKNDLDKVFKAYIRERDSNRIYFTCISCGVQKPVRRMHAGHFHSAGHNEAIRWHECNVNGQCDHCNYFLHGNYAGYLKGMLKKYGPKVVADLEIQRHNRSKMMKFEVQLLIDEYKKKLKE